MSNDETALTSTGVDLRKRHGRHYTPEILADFLAERLIQNLDDLDHIRVLDPACGDGELLLAVSRVAARLGKTFSLELVGFDLDADAISVARSRAAGMGLSVVFECADFLVASEVIPAGHFDAIITNPPYVRTQHLGAATAQLLADRFGLEGRIDLTHPFVAIAPRVLSPSGVLALLCSNRFLSTKAGANVRTVLMRSMRPTEIYDLGDTKLFGAAVLPAIIIASRHEPTGEPTKFVSAYEVSVGVTTNAQPLFDALSGSATSSARRGGKNYEVKVGTFTAPSDAKTPWRLSNPASDEWLESVKTGTWKTFGDVAKIRVGIKTTADKVFLGEAWDRTAPEVEDVLLLPLITQSNVTPWSIDPKLGMKVLYPYNLGSEKRRPLNIDEWPGAKRYLLSHEEQLRGRKYVIEGGREWWEIWVPQRPSLWASPKIVFPDISEKPRFALDTTGSVVNGNCYWISLDDIADEDVAFLMLAVANSAIGVRFYDEVCGNKLYSGKRRWITQYVNRLPLPAPTTPEARQVILHARALVASDVFDEDSAERLDVEVEAAFAASALAEPQRESSATTLF
ncbi:Eco57I restriction-modification methylase domain-containing protein [Agromyces sp. NPDC055520]